MESEEFRQSIGGLLAPDIAELIESRQPHAARAAMLGLMDPELADVLIQLEPRHRAIAFRMLPRDRAADAFTFLPTDAQEQILGELSNDQLAQVINEMDVDDRADLLDEMPGQVTARLLTLLTPKERAATQTILAYPNESVGRLMTSEYLSLRPQWTVQQALEHIREHGRDAETFSTVYVIDDRGRLLDDIRLRQLLLASPQATIESLMDQQVVSLHAVDDREEAVRAMERYDRPVLPVVDRGNVLVGIVTFDDVADVAEEENTEDMQKMGGMEALDDPYLAVPVLQLVRKRGLWLSVLFVGQTLTATAMGYFEDEIASAVVLALFIPLIISSGGNSGSQATSLIIRALAIGEITMRDWSRVLRREVACGLLLGLLLGIIGLLKVSIWGATGWSDYTEHYMLLAFTISASLIGVVIFGSIVGGMLPFLLKKLGLDPAASSAPFVATLVDVTGVIIYFTIAALLLKNTLLAT